MLLRAGEEPRPRLVAPPKDDERHRIAELGIDGARIPLKNLGVVRHRVLRATEPAEDVGERHSRFEVVRVGPKRSPS